MFSNSKLALVLALFVSFASLTLASERQVVSAAITVNAGDTLRIAPGTEMLFDGYLGITVKGRLEVAGTNNKPVKFASVNETKGTATPFDWNGIEILDGGSAMLSHTGISGAISGITAPSSESVVLEECIFENNGQWNLSIAGEIQPVPNGQPYSFKPLPPDRDDAPLETPLMPTNISTATEPAPKAFPAKPAEAKQKNSRNTWRWVLIGTGSAAAVGGAISFYTAGQSYNDYNAYVPGNNSYNRATPEERKKNYDRLLRNTNTAEAIGWTLLGLAAAEFLVLVIAF